MWWFSDPKKKQKQLATFSKNWIRKSTRCEKEERIEREKNTAALVFWCCAGSSNNISYATDGSLVVALWIFETICLPSRGQIGLRWLFKNWICHQLQAPWIQVRLVPQYDFQTCQHYWLSSDFIFLLRTLHSNKPGKSETCRLGLLLCFLTTKQMRKYHIYICIIYIYIYICIHSKYYGV